MSEEIDKLRAELSNAKREISNLRSKVKSLQHLHRKDIDLIKSQLVNFKCEKCLKDENRVIPSKPSNNFTLTPIGFVKTIFTQKRAIPRQAIVGDSIESHIEISIDAFTSNPEQSIEGLADFSHLWIFYHFHKNEQFKKPKIKPPRLNGKSVGVLSTRSPHRPNPIGMSLVKISKVEGRKIFFYGTDMCNNTPVIDVKPFIPRYDTPENVEEVKVPNWIKATKTFDVKFSEEMMRKIKKLKMNLMTLEEVLKHDPRSAYLRERYESEEFVFNFDGREIVCRFDDENGSVEVVEIKE